MAELPPLVPPGDCRYPAELTSELREALGMMIFESGPIAHLLRDAGYEIERKAEVEQAFVLHWLITLVLDHGAEWRARAANRIDELIMVLKAQRATVDAAEARADG